MSKTVYYCEITDRVIHDDDYIVSIPRHLMLREPFESWPGRAQVLAADAAASTHWATTTTAHVKAVVNTDHYLAAWTKAENRIRVYFLKHGFSIRFRPSEWREMRHLFFSPPSAETCLNSEGFTYSLMTTQDGVRLVRFKLDQGYGVVHPDYIPSPSSGMGDFDPGIASR